MATLAVAELLVPRYRQGTAGEAAALQRSLEGFPKLSIIDLDVRIASLAAALRAAYGLRTPDAIHAATALHARASGILINDRQFDGLQAEIRVWQFDDHAREQVRELEGSGGGKSR